MLYFQVKIMLPLDPIAEIGPKKSMPLNASDDSEVIQVMRPGSPVALGTMEPIIEVIDNQFTIHMRQSNSY